MTQVKMVMRRRERLFRAIAGMEERPCSHRRELTSEEKRIARHMAHEGASTPEIARAINWDLSVHSLYNKLKAINIKTKMMLVNYLHRD